MRGVVAGGAFPLHAIFYYNKAYYNKTFSIIMLKTGYVFCQVSLMNRKFRRTAFI